MRTPETERQTNCKTNISPNQGCFMLQFHFTGFQSLNKKAETSKGWKTISDEFQTKSQNNRKTIVKRLIIK